MTKGRIILPLALLVFLMVIIIQSFRYPVVAALGPWLAGGIAALLFLVQILREILATKKQKAGEGTFAKAEETGTKSGFRPYLELGAWSMGILIATYLLGMYITFPLSLFIYLKAYRQSWLLSSVMGVGMFVTLYLFFHMLMRLDLYRGIFLGG